MARQLSQVEQKNEDLAKSNAELRKRRQEKIELDKIKTEKPQSFAGGQKSEATRRAEEALAPVPTVTQEQAQTFDAGSDKAITEAERLSNLARDVGIDAEFQEPIPEAQERASKLEQKTAEATRLEELRKAEEEAQIKKRGEQIEATAGAFKSAFAQGREGVISSARKGVGTEAAKFRVERLQSLDRTIQSAEIRAKQIRDQISEAEKEGRKSIVKDLQSQLSQIETAKLEAQNEFLTSQRQATSDALNTFETITSLPAEVIAGLGADILGEFAMSAGLGEAAGIAIATKAQQLADIDAQLLKDPSNQDLINQRNVLTGTIDKIKSDATVDKNIEGFTNSINALVASGDITQDRANELIQARLSKEAGMTQEERFQFKTADGNAFIFDPKTGKTTEIKRNKKGGVASPTTSDIGTGSITQNYGTDVSRFNPKDHVPLQSGGKGTPGIDIDGITGDPIQSFVSGTVTQVATNGGYGNQVIITDKDGNEHMYSHLRDLDVPFSVGQKINAGDVVGFMGNSGTVFDLDGNRVDPSIDQETGSHLDYRVRSKDIKNGSRWADPNDFINKSSDYDKALLPLYAKFNNGEFKSADFKAVEDLGIDLDDFKDEALAAKVETDKNGSVFAQEIIELATRLKTQEGRFLSSFGVSIPYTDSRAFTKAFDTLISKLSLENLIDLKSQGATFGALSNQELQFITSSATELDSGLPDFNEKLDDIITKMKKVSEEITGEAYIDVIDQRVSDPTLNYLNQLGY